MELLKSEKIDVLIKALLIAKKEIHPVVKDAKSHHGKYADLNSCLDAINEPLQKNGLTLIQLPECHEGIDYLVSLLIHQDGQYIGGRQRLLYKDLTSQSQGSATSYARRYSLVALLGLSQVDDDGNAATKEQITPVVTHTAKGFVNPPTLKDPGDYAVRTGKKFDKFKIKNIPQMELTNYLDFISGEIKKGKIKRTPEYDELFFYAEQFFAQQEDAENLNPPAHITEDIPF